MPDTIPPGYKKTEIGIIAEDWEVKRLGDDFIVQGGPFGSSIKKEFFSKKGVPIYSSKNVISGDFTPYYFLDANYYDKLKQFMVKKGDLLLTTRGTVGIAKRFPERTKIGIIHSNLTIIRTNKQLNLIYFEYLFNSKIIQKQIENLFSQTTINALYSSHIKSFLIPLPPLPEQRAIARILSDIDELIESIDRLIEKKKLIKKGAMQELLTGKKRLPGFKGEWVRKRLGEILKYEQPTKYIVKNTHYLEVGFIPVLTAGKTFILGYTDEKDGIYNDVPVIIFDDFTTATKYVNFPFKVKSSAMKILKSRNEKYDLKFVYEKMQMIDFQINEGDHKRRWIAEYQNIEITLPPTHAEQKAIAQILSDMDAEIEALEKKKQKYEMIKKGMMELLLTGKVRVKEENGKIKKIGGIEVLK